MNDNFGIFLVGVFFNLIQCFMFSSVEVPLNISEDIESQLRAEVRQFVVTHSDHSWTGRAVARIFHGIQR